MPPMSATPWSLEIVRGRDVGRKYALRPGENVLGNALNGDSGIDLADQEGTSPRRMAAKQARVTCSERGLTLDDLESPGGTFVNRQRLLPGQARGLQRDDVIQLGSVQLKVVSQSTVASTPTPAVKPAAPPPQTIKTGPLPTPFLLASGHACRSWDDFLTVAAQRWPALREELTSGRLGAFLASVQRSDLIPSPMAPGSSDERLDDWLGKLPTTRPSQPELEVHPATLIVRAAPGGGVTRRGIQVTNVGYRLLRSILRAEPASASWIVVPPDVARGPVVTIDRSEVPIELHIPENWGQTLVGGLVIESNGGTKRIEIRLERPPALEAIPDAAEVTSERSTLGERFERLSYGQRLLLLAAGAFAERSIVILGGLLFEHSAISVSLGGAVALNALIGAGVAAVLARRAGDLRDLPTAAFAGGMGGVLLGAMFVAACRVAEPVAFLRPSVATGLSLLFWPGLGALAATLSLRLVPPHKTEREARP
ncbi:MAG: FHA domain-containing protein [Isosphaeraceae bacterium]|nr:FHA domain-containing protein [Isosphaeraceae bacterium]